MFAVVAGCKQASPPDDDTPLLPQKAPSTAPKPTHPDEENGSIGFREPPPPSENAEVWKTPCSGDYLVKAGPAASKADPHPTDYYRRSEKVPVATYITFELQRTDGASFPHCVITSSAYDIQDDGSRHVLTQRDRELRPSESVFYKSWIFKSPGEYLVEFREASTRRVLATYPLVVEAK